MAGIFYLGLAAAPITVGLALLVLVVLPYVTFERRSRAAWRKLATTRMGKGGPYRRVILRDGAPRAPLLVRITAMSCFFLGAGCLPIAGAAIAMIGAGDVIGIALFVPALVLLRLWAAGMRLLEPNAEALRSVRDATRGLVHVSFPLALASIPLAVFVSAFPVLDRGGLAIEGVTLVLALGAFSLVCLGECALLARATTDASRLLPDRVGNSVRSTLAIPAWMHRVIARKLVSQ